MEKVMRKKRNMSASNVLFVIFNTIFMIAFATSDKTVPITVRATVMYAPVIRLSFCNTVV